MSITTFERSVELAAETRGPLFGLSRLGFFLFAETLRARVGQLEDGTDEFGAWP